MIRRLMILVALAACSPGPRAPGPAAVLSGTLIDSTGSRVGGADGSTDTSFALPADLVGVGPRSLTRTGGPSVVIRARADDERSDPPGNASARVACAGLEPG